MEQIDRKLNGSEDPAYIAQLFSNLIEQIRAKVDPKQALAYLKNKCLSRKGLISDAARLSIMELVKSDYFRSEEVLADFVATLSSTSDNVPSLIKVTFELLNRQISNGDAKSFHISEHPLVRGLLLDSGSNLELSLFNGIVKSFHNKDIDVISLQKVYEPFFLYCLCNPVEKIGLLGSKLWSFLIDYDQTNGTTLIFNLCCWLQIQHSNVGSSMLDDLISRQIISKNRLLNLDYLILLQILAVHNMALSNIDCHYAIKILLDILPTIDFCHENVAILLLSKALVKCSSLYLEDLLKLSLHFCSSNRCQVHSYMALKSSLIYWLCNPSPLISEALKLANQILNLEARVCRNRPKPLISHLSIDRFNKVVFCNAELFFLALLSDKFGGATTEDDSIQQLSALPRPFLLSNVTFLCGLFIENRLKASNQIKLLQLIVECANSETLPLVLSVILYKLSNTNDSQLHFGLLKALPQMARAKENLSKVVATLRGLGEKSLNLSGLALTLLYETWKMDNGCYEALESFATMESDDLERRIAKSYVFKNLAENRPELYGKELVAQLSKVLNENTTLEGSIPTALALDGISHLCKAEVIDVITTWTTLAPKFQKDTRVMVVKSLCRFLGDIPSLEYTQSQSYEKLNSEAVELLWKYAENEDELVNRSALRALALYPLEIICKHYPIVYMEKLNNNQPTSEDRIVSGKCWVKFLASYKSRPIAEDFLIELVSKEVDNYLKYVYQIKARREPANYAALPNHSIVRALLEPIKASKVKEDPLMESCLKILSVKYSKPLPPLDWCFLQDLVHVPTLKSPCLRLASQQAISSGSARRLMENYIRLNETEDTYDIYVNLKYLANSIQPADLRPFFQTSLTRLLMDEHQLELSLNCLKQVLTNEDIQDVNKHVIEEVLTELIDNVEPNQRAFELISDCLQRFSPKALAKVCTYTDFSEDRFAKITKLRCYIAKNASGHNPLKWLDEIFVVAFKRGFHLALYVEEIASVLSSRASHEDSPRWFVDFLGEIQAKVADRVPTAEITYFCDILSVVAVNFSGVNFVMSHYNYCDAKYFLPASLAVLLSEAPWSPYIGQFLEWLHHMNSAAETFSVSEDYKRAFGWTVAALRHEKDFAEKSRWLKYLNCQI